MSDHRSGGGKQRSSAEIRADIEATRARLAHDIDAARTKLSRRGLEYEARSALRGVRSEASGAISGFSSSTDQQANQLSQIAVDTVKRYPVVTTLIGVGLALLALSNGRRSTDTGSADVAREAGFVKPTARADLPPTRH